MIALRDLFKKQVGYLSRWKGAQVISNFLQAEKLAHNKVLYKKYGVEKSIYAPIGSQDFNYSLAGARPWLDLPGIASSLSQNPDFQQFDEATQHAIQNFVATGLLVLRGFFSKEKIAELDVEIAKMSSGTSSGSGQSARMFTNAHRQSANVQSFFKNDKTLKILGFLLGKTVIPFQAHIGAQAYEQHAHADNIHLTTQPPGYLLSTWTAVDETTLANGPFFCYPGSHRLPALTTLDYDSGNTRFFLGKNSPQRYEDKVAAVIAENGLEMELLFLQKGDLIIWHANLLHGWEAPTNPGAHRRGMLSHYFCEDAICYHDIWQRPALLGTGK